MLSEKNAEDVFRRDAACALQRTWDDGARSKESEPSPTLPFQGRGKISARLFLHLPCKGRPYREAIREGSRKVRPAKKAPQ